MFTYTLKSSITLLQKFITVLKMFTNVIKKSLSKSTTYEGVEPPESISESVKTCNRSIFCCNSCLSCVTCSLAMFNCSSKNSLVCCNSLLRSNKVFPIFAANSKSFSFYINKNRFETSKNWISFFLSLLPIIS